MGQLRQRRPFSGQVPQAAGSRGRRRAKAVAVHGAENGWPVDATRLISQAVALHLRGWFGTSFPSGNTGPKSQFLMEETPCQERSSLAYGSKIGRGCWVKWLPPWARR